MSDGTFDIRIDNEIFKQLKALEAQFQQLNGKVTSIEKGTKNGTTSDFDGTTSFSDPTISSIAKEGTVIFSSLCCGVFVDDTLSLVSQALNRNIFNARTKINKINLRGVLILIY